MALCFIDCTRHIGGQDTNRARQITGDGRENGNQWLGNVTDKMSLQESRPWIQDAFLLVSRSVFPDPIDVEVPINSVSPHLTWYVSASRRVRWKGLLWEARSIVWNVGWRQRDCVELTRTSNVEGEAIMCYSKLKSWKRERNGAEMARGVKIDEDGRKERKRE